MGGVMAAAGAVSGMPEGAAASLPSAFLPGAAKRSHRLGSRPVPARSRAPEPPPGSPSRARSRSPSRASRSRCPRPLRGWSLGHSWATAGSGQRRAPGTPRKGLEPTLPLFFLLHQLLQLRAAAFPLSGCADAPLPRPLTLRPPQGNGLVVSGWPDTSPRGETRPGGPGGLGCPPAVVASPPCCPQVQGAQGGQGRCGRRPSPAQTRDFPQGERLNCSFQGFGI